MLAGLAACTFLLLVIGWWLYLDQHEAERRVELRNKLRERGEVYRRGGAGHLEALSEEVKEEVGNRIGNRTEAWSGEGPRPWAILDSAAEIRDFAVAPGDQMLVAGDREGYVQRWNFPGRELEARHRTNWEHGPIRTLEFSPKGELLAMGADRTLHDPGGVFFYATGGEPHRPNMFRPAGRELKIYGVDLIDVALTPDLKLFAVATDGTSPFRPRAVTLHDYGSNKEVAAFGDSGMGARALAFSPDGKILLAAYAGGEVEVIDVEQRKVVETFDERTNDIAFSLDGQEFAIAGERGAVVIRDSSTREVRRTLQEHQSEVLQVAYAPRGGLLASGDKYGQVKLWGPESDESLLSFVTPGGAAQIAFAHEAPLLLTGGHDVMHVWNLEELLAESENRSAD